MKLDITLTASTKASDFTKKERIELLPNATRIVGMNLPNTFRGWVARKLGIPAIVTVEVAKARRGRPPKS